MPATVFVSSGFGTSFDVGRLPNLTRLSGTDTKPLFSFRRDFWLDVVKRLWPKFQAFPLDKTDSHPCSFTDIVSGDWAAAYYSHIWSRMVAADIFSAFQEVSSDDEAAVQKLGDRYRNIVLGHGGGCHPSETFRQFRGRDPSPDALLALIGLRKPLEHCSEP